MISIDTNAEIIDSNKHLFKEREIGQDEMGQLRGWTKKSNVDKWMEAGKINLLKDWVARGAAGYRYIQTINNGRIQYEEVST